MSIQQHPDYHEGFFDAVDGEPLFEGECTPEYAAGWRAWWNCRDILASFDGGDLPASTAAIMPAHFARKLDA
jgi:hypothetical protein